MNGICLYVYAESPFNHQTMDELLRSTMAVEMEIEWQGSLGLWTLYGSEEQLSQLYSLIHVIEQDFNVRFSMTIVPRFDPFFAFLVTTFFEEGVSEISRRLIRYLVNGQIKKSHIPPFFKNIPKDHLDTVKAFIDSGMNASAAARILYIHRNTFNYRLTKFIEKTHLDPRRFHVALFVHLLIAL